MFTLNPIAQAKPNPLWIALRLPLLIALYLALCALGAWLPLWRPDLLGVPLAFVNLLLIIALALPIKRRWFKGYIVPLLLGAVALISGLLLNSWVSPREIILALMVSVALLVIVVLLSRLRLLEFKKQQLVLVFASLVFSIFGSLVVYRAGQSFYTFLWSGAACMCLCILLYNAVSLAQQRTNASAIDHAKQIVLLYLGLVANLMMMFMAVIPIHG